MPDRVIDAPIPDDPKCHLCEGSGAVDSGGNEPWGAAIFIKCGFCGGTGYENPLGPDDLAEVDRLMETHPRLWLHIRTVGQIIARLEAEKQDAHTEGWNAAIHAAANVRNLQRYPKNKTEDIISVTLVQLKKEIRALSKPTAAKQGDPS